MKTIGKPINPREINKLKVTNIPGEVFDAFNEMIRKNWSGNSATFKQGDVARLARKLLPKTQRDKLFTEKWMDVEGAYRSEGWQVTYDKPGYNEDYDATYTFTRP
jgi:hypothetical protein